MLHMGAVIPNLSFAGDAHYHHLADDIIEGGLMKYEGGSIAVPDTPGLGIKLDREKLRQYQELYKEWADTRTIRILSARVGRRSSRTIDGPTLAMTGGPS